MSSWQRTYLELMYGESRAGVHATVDVTLEASDLRAVMAYLMTRANPVGVWGIFDLREGGEGDALLLPKISAAALAAMPVSVPLQ